MKQVSLDTSFLISFADPGRKHHSVAVEYFNYCRNKGIPMNVSVIAAGEFEVGQAVNDLPLRNFRIQPFNLPHAIRAATFFKALKGRQVQQDKDDARAVILNDLKILAQAEEEGIGIILSEDASTLSKYAIRLKEAGLCEVEVVLLKDGFTPGRLDNPHQREIPLIYYIPDEEIEV
jgi:predicted nucleic acid-binding protein